MGKNDKCVVLFGIERPRSYALEYYNNVLSAYNDYMSTITKKPSDAQALYIEGFKNKLREMAAIIGIEPDCDTYEKTNMCEYETKTKKRRKR